MYKIELNRIGYEKPEDVPESSNQIESVDAINEKINGIKIF